jgi:hypothetical protein
LLELHPHFTHPCFRFPIPKLSGQFLPPTFLCIQIASMLHSNRGSIFFRNLGITYQTTRRHNPEDYNVNVIGIYVVIVGYL